MDSHWISSEPVNDAQFLTYVTNPTLPAIIEILFGVTAPTEFPRDDLVEIYLTGLDGLNSDGGVGEILRLNTAIDPVVAGDQNNYGVVGGDNAGFPNGRRLGDDIVDISLRAVMGVLLPSEVAPDGQLPYTDGTHVDATMFQDVFPYLNAPVPGSPNDPAPGSEFSDFVAAANSPNCDAIYLFDIGLNSWIYTSEANFPFFYAFDLESWLFYFVGTAKPREFFQFSTGQNITVN